MEESKVPIKDKGTDSSPNKRKRVNYQNDETKEMKEIKETKEIKEIKEIVNDNDAMVKNKVNINNTRKNGNVSSKLPTPSTSISPLSQSSIENNYKRKIYVNNSFNKTENMENNRQEKASFIKENEMESFNIFYNEDEQNNDRFFDSNKFKFNSKINDFTKFGTKQDLFNYKIPENQHFIYKNNYKQDKKKNFEYKNQKYFKSLNLKKKHHSLFENCEFYDFDNKDKYLFDDYISNYSNLSKYHLHSHLGCNFDHHKNSLLKCNYERKCCKSSGDQNYCERNFESESVLLKEMENINLKNHITIMNLKEKFKHYKIEAQNTINRLENKCKYYEEKYQNLKNENKIINHLLLSNLRKQCLKPYKTFKDNLICQNCYSCDKNNRIKHMYRNKLYNSRDNSDCEHGPKTLFFTWDNYQHVLVPNHLSDFQSSDNPYHSIHNDSNNSFFSEIKNFKQKYSIDKGDLTPKSKTYLENLQKIQNEYPIHDSSSDNLQNHNSNSDNSKVSHVSKKNKFMIVTEEPSQKFPNIKPDVLIAKQIPPSQITISQNFSDSIPNHSHSHSHLIKGHYNSVLVPITQVDDNNNIPVNLQFVNTPNSPSLINLTPDSPNVDIIKLGKQIGSYDIVPSKLHVELNISPSVQGQNIQLDKNNI